MARPYFGDFGLARKYFVARFGCQFELSLQVTFHEWRSVAVWKWMANDDACGICRSVSFAYTRFFH